MCGDNLRVTLFCGGLAIGSWRELPQLLDDFQAKRYPLLVEILVENGPAGLCRWAQREHGYVVQPEGYAGKCHLCVDVRQHLAERGAFSELEPQGFYKHLSG